MSTADSIADMLRRLHEADAHLQPRFEELVQRYFQFLKSRSRGILRATARLRLRFQRDPDHRIRRVAWTRRIKATKKVDGRVMYLTRQLPGPLRGEWIYHLQRDSQRRHEYWRYEHRRLALNSARSSVVGAVRDLRLSLTNRWAARASARDLDDAARIVEGDTLLRKQDRVPVAAALVLDLRMRRLEHALGLMVEGFRATFAHRLEIGFEPALRDNPNGTLRLYWGFPNRVQTSEGVRTFTDYIPGRPTDRWMRTLRIRAATRRELGVFLRRLGRIERAYGELTDFLGRHRKRANELLARIDRLSPDAQTAPTPFRHAR